MKMKRILLVANSLKIGGAEKSCVSFLNTLPSDKYEVDLMLLSLTGPLVKDIPGWVHLIEAPFPLSCLSHKPKEWKYYMRHSPAIWIKKVVRTWRARRQADLDLLQSLWSQWKSDIPVFGKEYDAAIGFISGFCNYFVIEKVKAKRKINWIHTDYDKSGCNPLFDIGYFAKADVIATMSQIAQRILQERFPGLASRVWFIENITDPVLLGKMADAPAGDDVWGRFTGLRIISCGRLRPEKSYESAIAAAAFLKQRGIHFKWILVGDGPEREKLECLKKEMDVEGEFCLVGARTNPYPYMKQADMLVVTSWREGRSLVIDEAKILGIPVITTNYPTAADAVEHEETGLICDMSPVSVAQAVIRLHEDKPLGRHIREILSNRTFDNTKEIGKYIEAIEGE